MQPDDLDVPALIRRAKAYDRDAFAVLYRRTLSPVYRYLASRLASMEEAEEVTQEVFLAALSQIQGLRAEDEPSLLGWLFQIARFKLADHLRARYRRPTAPLEAAGDPPDPGPLPEATMLRDADRTELREALARLTDEQREVVTYKYILGWSNEQTARQLGKNVNAVNQLHHRALRSLQRLLRTPEAAS